MSPARSSPLLADALVLAAAGVALREGLGDRRATCELRFSRPPPDYGFLVMAGVEDAAQALESELPGDDELRAARSAIAGIEPLLDRLAAGPLRVDLDAALDGSIVFGDEPVVSVEGRYADVLVALMLVRSRVGRATAAATRAARRVLAANGKPVVDGASARLGELGADLVARAAYVGGVSATTALGPGLRHGLPVHVTVSAPGGAPGGAAAAPLRPASSDDWGVANDHLIELGPGDDDAVILALRQRWASIGGFLVHDLDAPSLLAARVDLVALEQEGAWSPRLGERFDPLIEPGRKLVVRYLDERSMPVADVLHMASERIQPAASALMVGALGVAAPVPVAAARGVPLTTALLRGGRRVGPPGSLTEARQRAQGALQRLPDSLLLLRNPSPYPVGLSPKLAAQKGDLLAVLPR
jgi:nicotinate phosphoribosyltransferase family protein